MSKHSQFKGKGVFLKNQSWYDNDGRDESLHNRQQSGLKRDGGGTLGVAENNPPYGGRQTHTSKKQKQVQILLFVFDKFATIVTKYWQEKLRLKVRKLQFMKQSYLLKKICTICILATIPETLWQTAIKGHLSDRHLSFISPAPIWQHFMASLCLPSSSEKQQPCL